MTIKIDNPEIEHFFIHELSLVPKLNLGTRRRTMVFSLFKKLRVRPNTNKI